MERRIRRIGDHHGIAVGCRDNHRGNTQFLRRGTRRLPSGLHIQRRQLSLSGLAKIEEGDLFRFNAPHIGIPLREHDLIRVFDHLRGGRHRVRGGIDDGQAALDLIDGKDKAPLRLHSQGDNARRQRYLSDRAMCRGINRHNLRAIDPSDVHPTGSAAVSQCHRCLADRHRRHRRQDLGIDHRHRVALAIRHIHESTVGNSRQCMKSSPYRYGLKEPVVFPVKHRYLMCSVQADPKPAAIGLPEDSSRACSLSNGNGLGELAGSRLDHRDGVCIRNRHIQIRLIGTEDPIRPDTWQRDKTFQLGRAKLQLRVDHRYRLVVIQRHNHIAIQVDLGAGTQASTGQPTDLLVAGDFISRHLRRPTRHPPLWTYPHHGRSTPGIHERDPDRG